MLRVQRSRSLGYRGQHDLGVGGKKPENELHVSSTVRSLVGYEHFPCIDFSSLHYLSFADEKQAWKD